MKKLQQGFMLIELLMVIAIIGILAAIALPQYQNYIVRTRIMEGLSLAETARTAVVADGLGMNDLVSAETAWNVQANGMGASSKYVTSILFESGGVVTSATATGVITITYSANVGSAAVTGKTLILSPYSRMSDGTLKSVSDALADTSHAMGPVDWACTSVTGNMASKQLGVTPAMGTLPAYLAPAQCR